PPLPSAGDPRPPPRRPQIVFQNPYASLNPRRSVGAIVGQPLAVHGIPGDHAGMVADLLRRVRVPAEIPSGLDATVKLRVLALLRELQSEFHVAYLFISHDLAVVRQVADRVAVMYLGQIVEEAPTEALFERPRHPYTRGPQASVPAPDPPAPVAPPVLSGDPPSALSIPPG